MHRMSGRDEDAAWVAQSRNGDSAAFAALIRSHQAMIHSLTYRMTGSQADSQDLAQETFIRAHQQLDSYRGTSKFSSWLYRIAVNVCLDWRRREARRARLLNRCTQAAAEPIGTCASAEEELSGRVQAALMELADEQRAAIVLTVYGGHSHAEAGKILGCSETTVSWRIFIARRKLKKLLSCKGGCHE